MSPTTPTSSSVLFSLLAFGYLTGSAVTASPALQERQFGTGTGSGSVGCAALADSWNFTYSPSAVRACLESTPFSESVRTNTLDYIKGMLTLDVFEENHKQATGSVLDQNVDVRARLDEMETRVYTSDYAFQSEVSDLMWSLNDGHYYWTNCYDFFATAHGVPLVALSTDATSTDRSSIYIAPDIWALAREYREIDPDFYRGLDTEEIAGARVVQIEGQDVWDYLDGAADRAGVYQDKQQRLNSLFASPLVQYGGWDHDPGRFAVQRGFQNDSLQMTIVVNGTSNEMNIEVPWRTYWTSQYRFTYDSGEEFFSARCSSGSSDLAENSPTNSTLPLNSTEIASKLGKLPQGIRSAEFGRRSGSSVSDERLGHIAKTTPPRQLPEINSFISANSSSAQRTLYQQCPSRTTLSVWPFGSSVDPTRDPSYLGGRDVQFFALDQERTGGVKTGVIYVTTFDPQPATVTCFNRFILDVVIGLQNFTRDGVQRILVDTSNNGGGYVYLSGILQLALAGGQYEPDLNFEVLFRKADLSEAAVQAYVDNPTEVQGYWNPIQFLDADANPLRASDNWMNPGVDFPVGSAVLSASNRVQFATENSFAQIEGVDPIPPFTSEEIIFTGNGLCGSACGGFTSFLAEYYNTTGFISTAQPGEPITYTAFTSGNAVSSYYVDQELTDLGIASTESRPNLTTTAELGFSMSGSLSPRLAPGQFIQYRPLTANGTFGLTLEDYLAPVRKWEGVASRVFGEGVGSNSGGGARDNTASGGGGTNSASRLRVGGGCGWMMGTAVGLVVGGVMGGW